MSIRDKLSRLDTTSAASPQNEQATEDWIIQLQHELQIKVLREEKSFILLKENYYPVYNDPFFDALQENAFEIEGFQRLAGDFPEKGNLRRAFFVDTETTGLAGGTGTHAFLIGVGHIELDHIVVRQYLLPDFGHEWLLLKYVDQALQNFQYTVSFNGKSFDIPLLKSRYILNRMVTLLDEVPHVDVLHTARRIWKNRLPACNLQSLEKYILDIHRVADLPGEMVPQAYFEFIRKRNCFLLRDVLEHNYHDIVNMVLLTIRMAAISQQPLTHLNHSQDIFSVAKYFFNSGQHQEAVPLLHHLSNDAVDNALLKESLFLLAQTFRKLGNSSDAKSQLLHLLEKNVYHPDVVEALAKIYEHKEKKFSDAEQLVEKGLNYLEMIRQLNARSPLLKAIPRLQHRRKRLLGKLEKQQQTSG